MTARNMTVGEAESFLWDAFEIAPDAELVTRIEAYVTDCDMDDARAAWESKLAEMDDAIDPDSIEITPDTVDGADMPCLKIIIKIGGIYAS
jgi:hypothetical protein